MRTADKVARVGLLIAAHGERRPGATNEGVKQIAREISAQGLVSEVATGFINGVPTIGEAFGALTAPRIIVYPLFASSGYFTRDRLVQLLDGANNEGRNVRVLPPLGLDPGLPDLILNRVIEVACEQSFAPKASTVILLAHGSRRNSASREATEKVARAIEARGSFGRVRIALLEERPFLVETVAPVQGPAIIVGMFSGEGMHGANDAPKLIEELNRDQVAYAGVVGNFTGIGRLIARAVSEAIDAPKSARETASNA